MKLYLDDDSVNPLLVRLLRQAGQEVQISADVGKRGQDDALHLIHAIRSDRSLLTKNHRDFTILHDLILAANGHHPGILVVCQDNDPTRDMTIRGIVTALKKLLAANIPVRDQLHVLNHWR